MMKKKTAPKIQTSNAVRGTSLEKTSGACGLSMNFTGGCSTLFSMRNSFPFEVWRSDDGGKTWNKV
jgi:hypothetical protein